MANSVHWIARAMSGSLSLMFSLPDRAYAARKKVTTALRQIKAATPSAAWPSHRMLAGIVKIWMRSRSYRRPN
ncbi:hypothetical protein EDB81DRAFT_814470 [Dactylonectria macrodidyma]|uniref:Uncharacterized protein n=1 Tax=Dactylonectria macrodidyma TaxID=307937 RepID=A0A9P9DK00_9HYPO|nr:hypothetical protein EDB81DRAFT_814470 [Dactylonectria macrodidyma]